MEDKTKARLFWIIFFVVFFIIMYLFPLKKAENTVPEEKKDGTNKILILSDGLFKKENYEDTDEYNTYTTLLEKDGFTVEEYSMECMKAKTQLTTLETMDLDEYNTYIINLGFGDYTHNVSLYTNESESSFYYEVTSIINIIKQENENAKIIFVSDLCYEGDDRKNNVNYSYIDYYNLLKDILSKNNIALIDMYEYTKNNPIDISKTNDLSLELKEHNFLYSQLIDKIKE